MTGKKNILVLAVMYIVLNDINTTFIVYLMGFYL